MKLMELPVDVRNAVLQSVSHSLSRKSDAGDIISEFDLVLRHDYPNPGVKVSNTPKTPPSSPMFTNKLQWSQEFKKHFNVFFDKIEYPRKFRERTLNGELSGWLDGSKYDWMNTTPEDAVKSNISYWEQ